MRLTDKHPYTDNNSQPLPAFRQSNGHLTRFRQPYVTAIINYFNAIRNNPRNQPNPPIPPNPQDLDNQANPDDQKDVEEKDNHQDDQKDDEKVDYQNIQLAQILKNALEGSIVNKGMQKMNFEFKGKPDEDVVKFLRKISNYTDLHNKPKDVVYKYMISNCFKGHAADLVHENYGEAFCDFDTLINWLYKQFNGQAKLMEKFVSGKYSNNYLEKLLTQRIIDMKESSTR